MRLLLWQVIAAIAFVAAAPANAQSKLSRQVDAYLAPLVETHNFSGVVLIARGDKVLLNKGYGLASEELRTPHRPDDVFQIASLSKPFTATAVLKLAEQGKLDVRAPISKILPDYPNGQNITIHHLLTHTSGIPNVNAMPNYRELGSKRRTTTEVVAAFKDAKPDFAPGEGFAYSNSNFALLALIIEKVSGMPYGAYLKQEIFDPVGMGSTGHHDVDTAIIPHLVPGYVAAGRTDLARPAWFDWTVKTGNGSLYSSTGDQFRFVRAYFGGRVLKPETVASATRAADGVPPPNPGFEMLPPEMGYGWFIDSHLGLKRLSHPGSSPGFNSDLEYYPAEDLTIIVLTNTYQNVLSAADAFAAMALGKPYEGQPVSDQPVNPAEAAQLVGRYRFGADFQAPNAVVEVSNNGGRLSFGPTGDPSALLPMGPRRFIQRSSWATIEFELGPDRKVTGLRYSQANHSWRALRVD